MTHGEPLSTSEPRVSVRATPSTRKRAVAMIAVATLLASGSLFTLTTRPAAADQIATDQAQAAAVSAKIAATQGQIQTLTNQVQSADYQLSQLDGEIAANQ